MITKMEGMTISEEREVMEMMEMGDVLKDMDGNIHMEDVPDRRKKSSFARKNSIKFKGSLMLVTRKVETLGNIMEDMDRMEVESEEQAEHTEHGAQDRASSRKESGDSQEDIAQGIKYCPGVDSIILPVYRPVRYKPCFSGNRDLAEQKHF